MRLATAVFCAICHFGAPAQAHEFWLEPESYRVQPEDQARATFHVGQEFKGPTYSFYPARSRRFDWSSGDSLQAVDALAGDNPAFSLSQPPEGLLIVLHETSDSSLTYKEEGKFEAFTASKGLDAGGRTHPLPFKELYSRHAKALIAVGDGAGADRVFGLRHEIVAFANPYTDVLTDGMLVQILAAGKHRPGAQLEIFEKAPDGTVDISIHQADEHGFVRFAVKSGHSYLLDSVILEPREPLANAGAVWHTAWAALTFAVP